MKTVAVFGTIRHLKPQRIAQHRTRNLLTSQGSLSILAAQSERRQMTSTYTDPFGKRITYSYWRYTNLGEAMLVVGGLSIGAGVLPLIAAIALFSILLYKMWNLVQDGHVSLTPEKAVGFLFIPFFNFY